MPKPLRMWIDGRCFRIRNYKMKSKQTIVQSSSGTVIESECSTSFTEDIDSNYEITPNNDGKLSTSFYVPHDYYRKLAKLPQFCVQTLSNSTKTNISIPVNGTPNNLVITGDEEENIIEARNHIHSAIGLIRKQIRPLQFISVPVLSEEVKSNFEKFKTEILNDEEIDGIHESIFQQSRKLHLTISVFALLGENEQNEAVNALQEYKTTVLEPMIGKSGPLKLSLSGIDCMNNNFNKVRVLYANAKIVDENDECNLQQIANDLANYFYERGLVNEYQNNVKLHVTLMNIRYRKGSRRQYFHFDARKIMEKYKNYYFGECNLDSIHLSLMSIYGDDGYYKPLTTIILTK